MICKARDDLVLHVEEVGYGLVEALGPEMIASLGVDELDIDPHAVAAALHRTFEHVAHVQFAADLLHVEGLALVGKGGVTGDHERASDAREIGGQALGHAIDEIVLLGVAADIGEGQDDDREPRRPRKCRSAAVAFACAGVPTSSE